jgi:hypothetical protein
MQGEREHLLKTHGNYEVAGGQGGLRDILADLRCLADALRLDFGEALTDSEAVYEERLRQQFDPGI